MYPLWVRRIARLLVLTGKSNNIDQTDPEYILKVVYINEEINQKKIRKIVLPSCQCTGKRDLGGITMITDQEVEGGLDIIKDGKRRVQIINIQISSVNLFVTIGR